MQIEFGNFDSRTDLQGQRRLFRLCFPEHEGSAVGSDEHYRWKFHAGPGSPPSHEFKATADDKLLGYYAAIPYRYQVGGSPMTAGMVCDVMTHPVSRGQGIFTRIGAHATDELKSRGLNFVTGYPIRPEVIPGHLKVGWKPAFKLPLYAQVLRLDGALSTRGLGSLAKLLNPLVRGADWLLALPTRFSDDGSLSIEVVSAESLAKLPEYDSFFQAWQKTQRYHLIKDREFLCWRLGAIGAQYEIVLLRRNSELIGLAITRRMEYEGIPTLAVLDVMLLDCDNRTSRHLWQAIKRQAHERDAEIVAGIFSRYWARRYRLGRNGFLRTPFVITFIVKSLNNPIEESDFLAERNWHLCWIDSDDG